MVNNAESQQYREDVADSCAGERSVDQQILNHHITDGPDIMPPIPKGTQANVAFYAEMHAARDTKMLARSAALWVMVDRVLSERLQAAFNECGWTIEALHLIADPSRVIPEGTNRRLFTTDDGHRIAAVTFAETSSARPRETNKAPAGELVPKDLDEAEYVSGKAPHGG